MLDQKAASSHTHDDRYYTETETNILLGEKMTGASNDQIFANRPSVSIDGSVCGIPVTYQQKNQLGLYPVVGFNYDNVNKQLVINWYANGTIFTSKINIDIDAV